MTSAGTEVRSQSAHTFFKLPHMSVAFFFMTLIGTDFKSRKPHFIDLSFPSSKTSSFPSSQPSKEGNMKMAEGKKDIWEG